MLELKVSFKPTIYIRGPVGGNEMKIGELAGRSGLNASAIRYYERRGLLPVPHRSGGQRRYPADARYRRSGRSWERRVGKLRRHPRLLKERNNPPLRKRMF